MILQFFIDYSMLCRKLISAGESIIFTSSKSKSFIGYERTVIARYAIDEMKKNKYAVFILKQNFFFSSI